MMVGELRSGMRCIVMNNMRCNMMCNMKAGKCYILCYLIESAQSNEMNV